VRPGTVGGQNDEVEERFTVPPSRGVSRNISSKGGRSETKRMLRCSRRVLSGLRTTPRIPAEFGVSTQGLGQGSFRIAERMADACRGRRGDGTAPHSPGTELSSSRRRNLSEAVTRTHAHRSTSMFSVDQRWRSSVALGLLRFKPDACYCLTSKSRLALPCPALLSRPSLLLSGANSRSRLR
jgi:hypothetical protein